MKKIFKKTKAPIPVFCYLLALIMYIIWGLLGFSYSTVLRSTGSITTHNLTPTEVQLVDIIILPDGTLQSTSVDPQILFPKDLGVIESLTMQIDFSGIEGEHTLYHEKNIENPFGMYNRVWPTENQDNVFVYTPPIGTKTIRLDPTDVNGMIMEVGEITVNEQKSFFDFFKMDGGDVFYMVVIPALVASFISLVLEIKNKYKKKNN